MEFVSDVDRDGGAHNTVGVGFTRSAQLSVMPNQLAVSRQAIKRSAGVGLEVNLKECLICTKRQIRLHTLDIKLIEDIARNPKQGH